MMTLVYFRANDTHFKKKTLEAHISENVAAIQRRYRAQSHSLQRPCMVDGIGDLDLRK